MAAQISAGFARSGESGEAATLDDAPGKVTHLLVVRPALGQRPGEMKPHDVGLCPSAACGGESVAFNSAHSENCKSQAASGRAELDIVG